MILNSHSDQRSKIAISNEFKQINNLKSFIYFFICSLVLVSAGMVAYLLSDWRAYFVAFILAAISGDALLKLQHDAMHGILVSNKKLNILLGRLSSALMGTRYYDATTIHMRHHACLGGGADPNLYWYSQSNYMIFFMLKQLFGAKLWMFFSRTIIVLIYSMAPKYAINLKTNTSLDSASVVVNKSRGLADLLILVIIQALLFITMAYFFSWWVYFAFILLPVSTLGSFLEAVRSFSEHARFDECTENIAEKKRHYYVSSNFLERFVLSQFGFHYHHLHHLYPTVPVFNLPALHRWMIENCISYTELYVTRASYSGTLLKFIFKQTNEKSTCNI